MSKERVPAWRKVIIDPRFRSEGVSVADVNRDGKVDILAGTVWYEAPDWKPREIRPTKEYDAATGYSDCFHSFARDIDGDRWVDQIVIGMPGGPAVWYRNPGKAGGEWKEIVAAESAGNESPVESDINGDRRPDLIFPSAERMAWWRPAKSPEAPFESFFLSESKAPGCATFSHGLGVGDVSGDGRPDILCDQGYWVAPKDPKSGPWTLVKAPLGPECSHMFAVDFDGDGDRDVFSASAHGVGVWWHEQEKGDDGAPRFTRHVIDDSFSQSHAVVMADFNGDRRPDFVTGKRFWAHGPNGDVNPNDPAVLVWYEYRREGGGVKWVRREIDRDSGVGTQFVVADIDGDRRPDIVTSNKKGVRIFLQTR